MKKIIFLILSITAIMFSACSEEGELLVTDRTDAYISRFSVRANDNYTKLTEITIGKGIDTTLLTINAVVKYGTDLTMLKPDCSLSPESILEPEADSPKMGSWVDFTKGPFKYTVISGNRKVKKTYTITVTAQQ